MRSIRALLACSALLFFALPLSAQIAGTIQTIDAGGAAQSTFSSKQDVFLAAGSAGTPCQLFDYLPDGLYYFQVTDAAGNLLSTDKVSDRQFRVAHGVIQILVTATSSDGTEADPELLPPAHPHGPTTACGSSSVQLAPFSDAGDAEAAYLVWVTPASRFAGTSTDVADPACPGGVSCFHGFLPDASHILSFRVEDKRSCQPTFCVSGMKFADANGNGVRDSGESGIPGVQIRADGGAGFVLTALTGADGSYRICGLTEGGTFHISETVPSGYAQTGPLNHRISRRVIARNLAYDVVTCDKDYSGLDFGNQLLPNAVGGVKFEDLNANGVRDPGEPPVAGVTINWFPGVSPNPTGGSRTAVTDANGNFLFTNVTPGPFFLVETPPAGFTQTTPAAGFIPGTLTAGGSILTNVFGNFRGVLTGAISGTKFLDVNGNGVRDAGETGQAGVTFTISGPSGFTPRTAVTAADGSFTFTGVPFGTYTVTETVPAGFRQTAPPAPGTATATLSVSQTTVSGLLFGNQALAAAASVSGTKFVDSNSNGVRDAGEAGLAGVTIVLQTGVPGVGTGVMATTDASGNFSFTGLAPGAYTLSEVVPTGYVQTVPGGAGTIAVTLAAGENRTGILFGNAPSGPGTAGSVSGTKFLDLNTNGIVDGIDRPLEGITIVLTASDGTSRQIVSGADGTFRFDNVAPGTYVLSEILPPNFAQTFPGTPTAPQTYTVTVQPGQNAGGFLFLNKC